MSGVLRSMRPLARRLQGKQAVGDAFGQQRRCMADEAKVNAWEAPTQVAKWKEEHIVFAVLGGWGIGIYTAMKVFGGKEKEAQKEAIQEAKA
jgi:hypothetical protein